MSDLSPKELIKKEVLVIADEVKSSLKDIKKFALLEAWKILQMLVAIVVQIIEDTAKDLSGPEKKKIAIESIEAFYDKVFAHVDVPGIPGYLEPVLHSYIKKLMMIFVSASIDAMVATFRRVGVFTQKYIDFEWEGGILGLNDPRGATRNSHIFHYKASAKPGIIDCPYVDEEPVPQGLAGNSAYIIRPFAAKFLISKLEEYGAWPNDALMCNQICPWLKVVYPYFSTVQGNISTTTT